MLYLCLLGLILYRSCDLVVQQKMTKKRFGQRYIDLRTFTHNGNITPKIASHKS